MAEAQEKEKSESALVNGTLYGKLEICGGSRWNQTIPINNKSTDEWQNSWYSIRKMHV